MRRADLLIHHISIFMTDVFQFFSASTRLMFLFEEVELDILEKFAQILLIPFYSFFLFQIMIANGNTRNY